jgi:hypothetical protein
MTDLKGGVVVGQKNSFIKLFIIIICIYIFFLGRGLVG